MRELVLPNGRSPYADWFNALDAVAALTGCSNVGIRHHADWFNALDAVAAAKVTVAKLRMEQGNLSRVEWFRGIGECKIDWGPGYRIYLAKDGLQLIVLLGGGNKKRQQRDIDEACALWEEYKRSKNTSRKER